MAKRTNVSTRLLRYYEEQGLLTPGRTTNGYREYAEPLVDRVVQIRGLLDAGLPTRIIISWTMTRSATFSDGRRRTLI